MTSSRRDFIRKSALGLLGTSTLLQSCSKSSSNNAESTNSSDATASSNPAALPEMMGLQLYSVRDEMKADPLGTLRQLAAMGYVYVEHANYVDRKFYGYAPAEFKKVLDDLGLKMPSGHTVMGKPHYDETTNSFTDLWKYTIEDAAIVGQLYVISPWLDENLRKTESDLKRYMEVFNKSGELCKQSGMRFGYHNHDFEFSVKFNDVSMYDIMLQETDPNLVIQQLDIGNLYNGGAKAIDVVKKWPGRFLSMHVKDEIKGNAEGGNHEYESTVLGTGIVNPREVIDLGRQNGGTHHFIIEQEAYQGKAPIECMKENYAVMKKWGY